MKISLHFSNFQIRYRQFYYFKRFGMDHIPIVRMFLDAAAVTAHLPTSISQKFSSEWRRGIGDLKTVVSLLGITGIVHRIGFEYSRTYVLEGREAAGIWVHKAQDSATTYRSEEAKNNPTLNGMARLATVCSLLAVTLEGLKMVSHYKKIGPLGPKEFRSLVSIAWLAKHTLSAGFFLASAISKKDVVSPLKGLQSKKLHLLQELGFMLSHGMDVYKNESLQKAQMMQTLRTSGAAQAILAIFQSEKLQGFLPSSSQAYSTIKVAAYVSHLLVSLKDQDRNTCFDIFRLPYAYNPTTTPLPSITWNSRPRIEEESAPEIQRRDSTPASSPSLPGSPETPEAQGIGTEDVGEQSDSDGSQVDSEDW